MIPPTDPDGNLPPGIHIADWDEIEQRCGSTAHRRWLLGGLKSAIAIFRAAGCKRMYLDGSFVTTKRVPRDYDVAWEPGGMDIPKLLSDEPVFGDFSNQRAAQKAKYYGEFFPSSIAADPIGNTFLEFFQIDKNTGNPKGIIALNL
ncbi:MAG: hypothetical protein K8T91_00830 [Planctomycetes bacterium]|nr:hypothetical protein [Planctomycetota bacterium]